MKTYTISKLAKEFDLSRSTLLYYDRIGLLQAQERTEAGYRLYSKKGYDKLERICVLRRAGLPLAEIQKMLSSASEPSAKILEKRLGELGDEIIQLRSQQHLITSMLKNMTSENFTPAVNKEMWVQMLKSAGMDEADMKTWHAEFESRAPESHYEFLLSLGIPEDEARQIRKWSR